MEELVVAMQLVPGAGVIVVTLRPGEAHRVRLPHPLADPDGARYSAIDIAVDRVWQPASLEA